MRKIVWFGAMMLVAWGCATAQDEQAPAAAPVVAAPTEETVTMTGKFERQDKADGKVVFVFVENGTKKRLVVPNNPKILPENTDLATLTGELTMTAVLLIKERDGKIIKPIKHVVSIQPVGGDVAADGGATPAAPSEPSAPNAP